jgi:outer membrane protein W
MNRIFSLAAALLFAATTAHAQQRTASDDWIGRSQSPATGWYGQVSAGYLQLRDNDGNVGGTAIKSEYDAGWTLTGALGYGFGNGFRAELEGGYGRSSYDSVTVGGSKINTSADIDIWSAYAAGYYDFWLIGARPYVGAGAGLVHAEADDFAATSGGTTFRGPGGDSTDFSMFGEVGLTFPLGERLDLVPAVRYVWIDNSGGGQDDDTAWVFKAGLRYSF